MQKPEYFKNSELFPYTTLLNSPNDIVTDAATEIIQQKAAPSFTVSDDVLISKPQQIIPNTLSVMMKTVDKEGYLTLTLTDDLHAELEIYQNSQKIETITFGEDNPIFFSPVQLRQWLDEKGIENLTLHYKPNLSEEEYEKLDQNGNNFVDDMITLNNMLGLSLHRNILKEQEKETFQKKLSDYTQAYRENPIYSAAHFEHIAALLTH